MHETRAQLLDKVSNGRPLPKGIDLRSAAGRRYRYLVGAYSAELGPELSEPEKALIAQAVVLQLRAEQLGADVVAGERVDPDLLIRVSNVQAAAFGHRRQDGHWSTRRQKSDPGPDRGVPCVFLRLAAVPNRR
jgi:hypothetical protein